MGDGVIYLGELALGDNNHDDDSFNHKINIINMSLYLMCGVFLHSNIVPFLMVTTHHYHLFGLGLE